ALGLDPEVADRVLRCLADLGLPLGHPALREGDALFQGLEEFRQHLGGRLTLTMLRGVGDPIDVHEIDEALMRQALRRLERLDRGGWAPPAGSTGAVAFDSSVARGTDSSPAGEAGLSGH